MKSIIKTKSEKMLLTVNIQNDKLESIKKIFSAHGGRVIEAAGSDGGQKLGFLFGFKGFEESKSEPREVADELAVFSGIDGTELNVILRKIRAAGISIPLKAVCTGYNQSWALCDLACELKKEHEMMNGGGKGE